MPVLPPIDPLLAGLTKVRSFSLPIALQEALERGAAIDGERSVSSYVARLLVYALRKREAEREALKPRK